MKDLLEKNNLLKPAKIGEIIEGKIIGSGRAALFLDLGILGAGIIFGREFYASKNKLKDTKIGDKVFAKIVDLENEQGFLELSLSQASDELSWEKIKQQKEKQEILTVKISGANKGGLLAEAFGIPAFLPVSQLLPEHYPKIDGGDTSKILRELQKFISQEFKVKIFDFSRKEKKLILSEKAGNSEKIKELLKKIKPGDIKEGEITGITEFGAFMKLSQPKTDKEKNSEIEGLIHISELDWQIIESPSQIVKVGQKIKAKILEISGDKIFLSLKALKKDPWQDIEKKYKKGDIIKGKITKLNPYGAFVQLTPKTQGLCHISEFGTKLKMEEVLKIDKKYDFQILFIEPKEHRMSLRLVKK